MRARRGVPGRGARGRLLAFVLAVSAVAAAEPTPEDRALAERLFQDARDLMDQKRFVEACPKLQESQRIAPAGGTLLNLASCHEASGRIAAAWAEYRDAEAQARKANRPDREKIAHDRSVALEPLVPRLVVVVPPELAAIGVRVTRDGSELGPASWSSEIPVDPGFHVIRVTAAGFVAWERRVELAVSKIERVVVPPLVRDSAELVATPTPSASASASATVPSSPPRADAPAGPGDTARVVGLSMVGVGAVALGIGSYFGVHALQKRSESDTACPAARCSPQGVALNEDARAAARLSNVALGAGLILAGGGALLLFAGPPDRAGTASLGVGLGHVTMRGSF